MNNLRISIVLFAGLLIAGCNQSNSSSSKIFTLYRNSALDETMRIHVATFDAADGEAYNRRNCDQAQLLFQTQSGVKTKFWCEKGFFRK